MEDAIRTCEEALKVDPNNASFYKILGDLYYQKKESARSADYYEKAILK